MSMLYNRIAELCKYKDITVGKMSSDLGLSRGMMTDLKMGRKKSLSSETLNKISSYFLVTVDYLLGNTDDPTPPGAKEKPANTGELTEDQKTLIKIIETGTDEQVAQLRTLIEAALRLGEK